MKRENRLVLEMGKRTDEFSAGHPDTDAGYTIAAGRLTRLVEQGFGLVAVQRDGRIDEHAGSARRKELRLAMRAGPIAHLAEVGKLAAREQHELGKAFTFKPSSSTYLAFRAAAGSMAAAAQTHKDLLIKHGLSESVLAEFAEMLNQFDEAVTLASNGRTAHVAATKNLDGVTREIARVVRVMNARNRQRFRDDGQLLNSWISASTVLGTPRPVTAPKDGASSPQDSAPSAPTDVRPAA
jgi:hypothetical protein